MIAAHITELKNNAIFYIVGTPTVIRDICSFADLHSQKGDLYPSTLMRRIQMHSAYCYVKPLSFSNRLLVWLFKRQQLRANRWIDFDTFLGAFIISDPEEALQVLPFSAEELLYIMDDNPWLEIFNIDADTVKKRLRAALTSPTVDPSFQSAHSC